ncbi:MAG: RecQ family ATP-dependent DNA helicase [Candidatus Hydrogenedentes bacterium]|nr:RecQ family ATP-dependent DNA helicase [Candidatus Hydrogenedentota bacterium]
MKTAPQNPARLLDALRKHFGFSAFMAGQEDVMRHVLDGKDTVVIMPTGSGKSLCYQLPALLLNGVTLVVSPLIALMKDQVDGLAARGLPATFLNSSLTPSELAARMAGLDQGRFKLVYVAPERFRNRRFLDTFQRLETSLLAIDEAHCISQWGHDFRPDYLRLRPVAESLPKARIMALTATATPEVRSDIVKQLALGEGGRSEPQVLVHGFERPNLRLVVSRTARHADKLRRVRLALKTYPTGIVYCATRKQTERVAAMLADTGQPCCLYHGGLPDEQRSAIQEKFMRGGLPVVVATNAFGMGIDRADLRFVIHWDIPGSIEAYYQEIGRAGRDGKEALCELLFNFVDVRTQEFFLEGNNPAPELIRTAWNAIRRECAGGPVTRSLEEWALFVPVGRNEMAVRTAFAILEQAGLISRETAPGDRTYTTRLVEGADVSALDAQLTYLAEKRRRDERKLKAMLRYVDARGCRHAYILNYFGEHNISPHCQACDHCRESPRQAGRAPTEEEWVLAQKILSCVARMKGRFGCGRVVEVLLGSKAAPVLERRLDKLSTYGLLKGHKSSYVRAVLDELIRDGCAAVADGEYPLVSVTERGLAAANRKAVPSLVWPELPKRKAPAAGGIDAVADRLYDPALFEALKAWRMRTAKAQHVPAYVIMHDKTLKAIAVVRPQTLAELENIKGIGPSRVARYGDALLAIVDAAAPASDDSRE